MNRSRFAKVILHKTIRQYIPFFVTIFLFYILVHTFTDIPTLHESLKILTFDSIILLIFLSLVTHATIAYRWYLLLKVNTCNLPYKQITSVFFANLPIAKFSPGYTGDFIRSFLLRKEVPVAKNVGIIGLEAIIDIAILLILSSISGVTLNEYRYTVLSLCLLTLIPSTGYVINHFFKSRTEISPHIKNIITGLSSLKNNIKDSFYIILVSVASSLLNMLYIFLLFISFNVKDVSFAQVLMLHPLVILMTLIPISLWGIGIRESIMIGVYGNFVAIPILISMGITYTILSAVVIPLLCLPFTYKILRQFLIEVKNT